MMQKKILQRTRKTLRGTEFSANQKSVLKVRLSHCILPLMIAVLLTSGCKEDNTLSDFRSDGCSLFPDRNQLSQQDWCECCFEHDITYWMGGTKEERLHADSELRECVIEKTGNTGLADLMFDGVRLGGSPYFYNWYRWGYGWSYDRKYQELTEKEKTMVQRKLDEYFESQPINPCSGEIISRSRDR